MVPGLTVRNGTEKYKCVEQEKRGTKSAEKRTLWLENG